MKIDWKKVLPVVSSIGVAVTSGLSFYGGMKYQEKKEEKGKKALLYLLPGAAAAVGTIASIAVTGRVTAKEIAVLTGSCAYLVHERDKIKEVTKERLVNEGYTPEEADEAIKEDTEEAHKRMAAEIVHNGEKFSIPAIEETGHGDLLCIEGWSGRAFRSSREHVEAAVSKFKARYEVDHESENMNDLYDLLGIRETHMGHYFGYPNYYSMNADGSVYNEYFDQLDIYIDYADNVPEFNEPALFIEYGYDSYPLGCYPEY